MNMKRHLVACALFGAALLAGPAGAVTVNSTDAIYNYGGTGIAGGGSTTPPTISVAAFVGQFLTFGVTGAVALTPGGEPFGPHGADGGAAAFNMNVSQGAGISGVHSFNVGYLAGVFLNGSEGATTGLPNSDFTPAGTGEAFASLSPMIDQVFFIGDGLTGTGAGQIQQFFVPTGATRLVLGTVDAYGYDGPPGAYFDNSGFFSVNVGAPAGGVPEPATWMMLIGGFGLVGGMMRRRRVAAAVSFA